MAELKGGTTIAGYLVMHSGNLESQLNSVGKIGDKSTLTTTNKNTIVEAINEINSSKLASNANAVSASKWQTARTITLGGDLTGSVSLDGSANVTLTATVSDDSHSHTIANVDGLQTALDGKLGSSANAVSASKLETARTISLTGTVTGSASFDGSANASIATTVADGTTSAKGIVQLSSATNSTSTTLAATASAVKAAYDLANGKAGTAVATTGANGLMSSTDKSKLDGIEASANNYSLPTASSTVLGGVKVGTNVSISSGTISVADGTTSAKGVVQLSTSTTSTSTTLAATPSAVKAAMDKANEAFQSASDGKTAIAGALTSKGYAASSTDSFSSLASKIEQLPTNIKGAKKDYLVKAGKRIDAGEFVKFDSAGTNYSKSNVAAYSIDNSSEINTAPISNDKILECSEISSKGIAKIITVSDGISYIPDTVETSYTFSSGSTTYISLSKIDSTRFLVTYVKAYGKVYARILVINGTTITGGTEYAVSSVNATWPSSTMVSSDRAAIAYFNSGAATGSRYLVVKTLIIDGTTITMSEEVTIHTDNMDRPCTIKTSDGKAMIFYNTGSGGQIKTAYAVFSGPKPLVYSNTQIYGSYYSTLTGVQLENNKLLIIFKVGSNNYTYSCIVNVDGNGYTNHTVGSLNQFRSTSNLRGTVVEIINSEQVFIAYGIMNGYYATQIGCTIMSCVGTSTSVVENFTHYTTTDAAYQNLTRLSNNKIRLGYNEDYCYSNYYQFDKELFISDNKVGIGLGTKMSSITIDNNRVLVCYTQDSTKYVSAQIVTTHGEDITYSDVFSTTVKSLHAPKIDKISGTKFIVVFQEDVTNAIKGMVVEITSDNQLTLHPIITIHNRGRDHAVAMLGPWACAVTYCDYDNNYYGTAKVVNISSGNDLTANDAFVFSSNSVYDIDMSTVSDDEVMVVYSGANNYGQATKLRRNGNSFTIASTVNFRTYSTNEKVIKRCGGAYSNKMLVIYESTSNGTSYWLNANTLVSTNGTNSITTSGVATFVSYNSMDSFNLDKMDDETKMLISYEEDSANGITLGTVTISGSSPVLDTVKYKIPTSYDYGNTINSLSNSKVLFNISNHIPNVGTFVFSQAMFLPVFVTPAANITDSIIGFSNNIATSTKGVSQVYTMY